MMAGRSSSWKAKPLMVRNRVITRTSMTRMRTKTIHLVGPLLGQLSIRSKVESITKLAVLPPTMLARYPTFQRSTSRHRTRPSRACMSISSSKWRWTLSTSRSCRTSHLQLTCPMRRITTNMAAATKEANLTTSKLTPLTWLTTLRTCKTCKARLSSTPTNFLHWLTPARTRTSSTLLWGLKERTSSRDRTVWPRSRAISLITSCRRR